MQRGDKVGVRSPLHDQSIRSRVPSFVMTLWLEPRETPADPEWRWRVVEVPTGEQRYFRRLDDLLAYVSEKAGVPPPR
ncbi:MAG: hypothetical protein Q7K03_10710 [Dehalococcoidia bacterium]|nr:hypothetical protein [Dehalococcoidia bacterium]